VRSSGNFFYLWWTFHFAAVTAASGVRALGRPHPFVTCPFVALAVMPFEKVARNSKDRLEQVEKAKREMMERAGQEWNGTGRGHQSVPESALRSRAVAEATDDLRAIRNKRRRKLDKTRKILSWAASS